MRYRTGLSDRDRYLRFDRDTRSEPNARTFVERAGREDSVILSTGTALELFIVTRSKWGDDGIDRLTLILQELRVTIVPVDIEQMRLAIDGHRRFGRGSGSPARLNFGDCFAYALAKATDMPLLFEGDDFGHTDIRPAL